ncbi:MAG: ATP-binding protein [Candidatus Syntropharchaeia archaeon]
MKKVIGVSGKGGTGKTVISALLIKLLSGKNSILAIDADPDSNLPEALGVEFERTVGDVREGILESTSSRMGISDPQLQFQKEIAEIIKEEDDYDLIVMGRPEGPGCYCPVNNILREIIDTLSSSYDYTIIDCEAGLEHLSRRTTRDVDVMLVVSNGSVKGLKTAQRIKKIAEEINVDVRKIVPVANRIPDGMENTVREEGKKYGIDFVEIIPFDPLIAEYDMRGIPVVELPETSPVIQGVKRVMEKIL